MAENIIPLGVENLALADAEEAFFGAAGNVYRRVDIHNADGSLWQANAPVLGGDVTVDYSRAERRTLDLQLDNNDGNFTSDPDGFWYDKILKVYRGVRDDAGLVQSYQLGEFYIDRIDEDHFPHVVSITARDSAKRMILAKFPQATAFAAGVPVNTVITALAVASGVTRFNFANVGVNLTTQFMWEAGTARWEAASALAEAHGQELFFDRTGTLTLRPFVDPTTAPVQYVFDTGYKGNLATYSKSTNDTRIFNHILVKGGNTNEVPVTGVAENNEPSSPTRIARIGRRTYVYESKLISTNTQAQDLATALLRIMALESYELSLDALVAPWLDVGLAIGFEDPNPSPYAPTSYLLTGLTIPLEVGGLMSAEAKRVTLVG